MKEIYSLKITYVDFRSQTVYNSTELYIDPAKAWEEFNSLANVEESITVSKVVEKDYGYIEMRVDGYCKQVELEIPNIIN